MENASKALLMAGGILISLLILTIGVILYNTFSNTAAGTVATWDAAELSKYNSSFVTVMGRNDITAQEIVSLITLSQQRNEEINIFVGNENAKSWNKDKINEFLKANILTTEDTGEKVNDFSYVQNSIKYDQYGRVNEIKFKKN